MTREFRVAWNTPVWPKRANKACSFWPQPRLYPFKFKAVRCCVVDAVRGRDVPVTVRKWTGCISLLARFPTKVSWASFRYGVLHSGVSRSCPWAPSKWSPVLRRLALLPFGTLSKWSLVGTLSNWSLMSRSICNFITSFYVIGPYVPRPKARISRVSRMGPFHQACPKARVQDSERGRGQVRS